MKYSLLVIPIMVIIVALTIAGCKKIPNEPTTTTESTTTEFTGFVPSPQLEPITERLAETTTKHTTTMQKAVTEPISRQKTENTGNKNISPAQFRRDGVIYDGGYRYTWYSEKVLPGGALDIPGRWSDGNYVRDEDDYIVLASSDLPRGTIVETPFGTGKVYDSGCASGVLDVYVSW